MPVNALPEIDDATEKALEDPARSAQIVEGYRRLIGAQLARVRAAAAREHPADVPPTARSLADTYPPLAEGLDELLRAGRSGDGWSIRNQLLINIRRFNDDALQERLGATFSTRRPPPDPGHVRKEFEMARHRIEFAIRTLREKVVAGLGTGAGKAALSSNFPAEAVGRAGKNIEGIVTTLERLLREKGGFLPNYDLPSNQPAHQTFVDGRPVIEVHPTEILNSNEVRVGTLLMHEGSHAMDPAGIVDYLYRNTGLHRTLPAPLALGNAANYEQTALDLLSDGPPAPAQDWPLYIRLPVAYLSVRITRAWVAASNSASRTAGGRPGEQERRIALLVDAPLGLGRAGTDPVPAPLPVDKALMGDVYDAMSVLLGALMSLQLGGTRRGPLTVERDAEDRPRLCPGEASAQSGQEALQDQLLDELTRYAEETGDTGHVTAAELRTIVHSTLDLVTAGERAGLSLLQEAPKPASEKKGD
ncbi:hypothetical protein [Planomonospora algeriensis]